MTRTYADGWHAALAAAAQRVVARGFKIPSLARLAQEILALPLPVPAATTGAVCWAMVDLRGIVQSEVFFHEADARNEAPDYEGCRLVRFVESPAPAAAGETTCPRDCPLCSGEACAKCGAGLWRTSGGVCEHDSAERHEDAAPGETATVAAACVTCGGTGLKWRCPECGEILIGGGPRPQCPKRCATAMANVLVYCPTCHDGRAHGRGGEKT